MPAVDSTSSGANRASKRPKVALGTGLTATAPGGGAPSVFTVAGTPTLDTLGLGTGDIVRVETITGGGGTLVVGSEVAIVRKTATTFEAKDLSGGTVSLGAAITVGTLSTGRAVANDGVLSSNIVGGAQAGGLAAGYA